MTSAVGHSLQVSWVHTTTPAPPPQALFSLGIPRVPLNPSWFCVRAPKAHMSHPPPDSLAVGTHSPPSVPKPPEKQMMGVSQNKEPLHRVSPRIVAHTWIYFSIHWHNEWQAGACDSKLLFFNELVHYCPTHVASATYHLPLQKHNKSDEMFSVFFSHFEWVIKRQLAFYEPDSVRKVLYKSFEMWLNSWRIDIQ